jgi:putative ABC transport system permease protein
MATALTGSHALRETLRGFLSESLGSATHTIEADFWPSFDSSSAASSQRAATEVKSLPGVQDAFLPLDVSATAGTVGGGEWLQISVTDPDGTFTDLELTDGAAPAAAGEIAVAAGVAERLGLEVGDSLDLGIDVLVASEDGGAEDAAEGDWEEETWETQTVTTEVTGVFEDPVSLMAMAPSAYTSLESVPLFKDSVTPAYLGGYGNRLLIRADPDLADDEGFAASLAEAVAKKWSDDPPKTWSDEALEVCSDGLAPVTSEQLEARGDYAGWLEPCEVAVRTAEEDISQLVRAFTGEVDVLTVVGLVFGLLALFVACLVIANTFQVMIAGRARTLALLRAVGATRQQVRRSVIWEGALTGLGASVVGVLVGWGLVNLALLVAGRLYPTLAVPDAVYPPWWTVAVCLVVGTGATMLASLWPARLATRVAPVEALRPQSAPTVRSGAGRVRLGVSALLDLIGAGGVAGALLLSRMAVPVDEYQSPDETLYTLAVLVGVLGCCLLAVGLILGAVFWLPKVVGAVARLVARVGPGPRLASANAVRNPRRTAATATALLVGVTLVSALVAAAETGAESAVREVGSFNPIDLSVGSFPSGVYLSEGDDPDEAIADAGVNPPSPELVSQIKAVDGVAATLMLDSAYLQVDGDAEDLYYAVAAADPSALARVLNADAIVEQIEPQVILAPSWVLQSIDPEWQPGMSSAGDEFKRVAKALGGSSGEVTLRYVSAMDMMSVPLLTHPETVESLGAQTQPTTLLLGIDTEADAVAVVKEVQSLVSEADSASEPYWVDGNVMSKVEMMKAVDVMVLIGVALLAVSVFVALIGVSNTLSLSVIERARETALLRALGLTRGGTRWMMAVEGLIIAGVAGLAGVVLGCVFGVVGITLLIGNVVQGFVIAIPWARLAIIFALACVAGLAASVLPGRRAAKTPPTEALGAL